MTKGFAATGSPMTTELRIEAIETALERDAPAMATDSESLGDSLETTNRMNIMEKRGTVLEAQVGQQNLMLLKILGRLGGPASTRGVTALLLPPSLGGAATAAPASKAKSRNFRAEPLLMGLASFASANDYQSADSEASGEDNPDVVLGNLAN